MVNYNCTASNRTSLIEIIIFSSIKNFLTTQYHIFLISFAKTSSTVTSPISISTLLLNPGYFLPIIQWPQEIPPTKKPSKSNITSPSPNKPTCGINYSSTHKTGSISTKKWSNSSLIQIPWTQSQRNTQKHLQIRSKCTLTCRKLTQFHHR